MYKLLIITLMVSGYLADETSEALKSLEEHLQNLESLPLNSPVAGKRKSHPPDHFLEELLNLLEQGKGFSRKRSSEETDEQGQEKDIKDNKTDKQKEFCTDERDDCEDLKSKFPCDHQRMRVKCARTCKACYRCEDTVDKKMCKKFVELSFCDYKPMISRMKDLCYESCGFCRQPAPPACTMSKHGCCWDLTTSRKDKKGSNCPRCIDKRPKACKTFAESCDNDKQPGIWMKKNCPVTCKLCKPDCQDKKEFEPFCEEVVLNGNCGNTDLAKLFCRKSCNFCK